MTPDPETRDDAPEKPADDVLWLYEHRVTKITTERVEEDANPAVFPPSIVVTVGNYDGVSLEIHLDRLLDITDFCVGRVSFDYEEDCDGADAPILTLKPTFIAAAQDWERYIERHRKDYNEYLRLKRKFDQ